MRNLEKINLVLNNLASHYLNYSSQERKTEINQGLDFVNAQLPVLRGTSQYSTKTNAAIPAVSTISSILIKKRLVYQNS
jgi:hypothetical protein